MWRQLYPLSDVFKLQVDCYFYANGGNRHPASRPAKKKKKKRKTLTQLWSKTRMGKQGNGEGKAGKSMSSEGVNFVRQLAKVFPLTGHASMEVHRTLPLLKVPVE